MKKVKADKEGSFCSHRKEKLSTKQQDLEAEAKWLWYEFSPYEVGCDVSVLSLHILESQKLIYGQEIGGRS